MNNKKRMTFMVTVEFSDKLEPTVVKNYVNLAIAKYYKHSGNEISDFFDGVSLPKITVKSLPEIDQDDIVRSSIKYIQEVKEHLKKSYEIEDKPWE